MTYKTMKLYLKNTQTGKKEEFIPQEPGVVRMYNCGPTVYDHIHIGNLRTLIMNDLIRRTLEQNQYKVLHVTNITDVDDKMIRGAKNEGLPLKEFAKKYEAFFLSDIQQLNIKLPTKLPRATEHIADMISMIEVLLKKGTAYVADDGVYFSIEKSAGYGKLAHLELRTETRSRIQNDEYGKENPQDFALWKFAKEGDEIFWDAPFGKGRPGWHIECSAMSLAELGKTLDIHTGGADLIFPHHTNEIAQSESANDAPFARYWVHGAMLASGENKMSKSLGNFTRLTDLIEAGIHPLAYRYFLLGAHYSTTLNFSLDAVFGTQIGLEKILHEIASLIQARTKPSEPDKTYIERFTALINDDLDMPKAVALFHELLKSKIDAGDKLATLAEFDKVFGLDLLALTKKITEIPVEISDLNEERERERVSKNWERADALRNEIEKAGFNVYDLPIGSTLERKLSSLLK